MGSGGWKQTDTGRRLLDRLFVTALTVGAAVVALVVWALWSVLVVLIHAAVMVAPYVWESLPYIAVFEVLVAISAVLDWRESRLSTRSWKHAWLVGHRTVIVRAGRRSRWVTRLLGDGCKQLFKTPNLDAYAPPYRGAVVLELERPPRRVEDEAA